MTDETRQRLLLVEDHGVFREGLRMLLDQETDLAVAAEASSGREALQLCQQQNFDVILLDIRLPDMSGIDVAHQLVDSGCGATIVMLSMRDEAEVRESLPPGVCFVSKAEAPTLMIETIRRQVGHSA